MAMKRGQLRRYFTGVAAKRLTAVDAEPASSNQHEVGTTRAMREQFLGTTKSHFRTIFIWLGQDRESFRIEGTATHYDARRLQPRRAAEWRLYYPSNSVTEVMKEGDMLFLAGGSDLETLYFIVTSQASTSERQLSWLFDLYPQDGPFVSRSLAGDEGELDFAGRFILEELELDVEVHDEDRLDEIIEPFGTHFPSTRDFSSAARRTAPEVNAEDDPDTALIAWLDHEEAMFRRLERRIVTERLGKWFEGNETPDVDEFVKFSLSVHNRRKSRMGYALENHLGAIFQASRIAYVRGAVTEIGNKPDFLFPSIEAYWAAPETGDACLTVLGAKSTCKERWRQVLPEAAKVPEKHLLTLEPGVSEAQTNQMKESHLQLVVPVPIQSTYTGTQIDWLWSLKTFIETVRDRAAGSHAIPIPLPLF